MGVWASSEQAPATLNESEELSDEELLRRFRSNYRELDRQRVLVVGDGNLSFSLALSRIFNNIELIATTYDSRDLVQNRYASREIIAELESSGAQVKHEIDATDIAAGLGASFRAHYIIFNFPHHPGKGMIQRNRDLIRRFFQSAAGHMEEGGEVRVSLAQGQGGTPVDKQRVWGDHWQLTAQAACAGLILKEVHEFFPPPGYTSCGYKSMNKEFRLQNSLEHVLVPDDRGVRALYPPTWTHDISFWVGESFDDASFVDLARSIEAVTDVELFDQVLRTSLPSTAATEKIPETFVATRSFRVTYMSETKALSQDRARDLQFSLRDKVTAELGCILR